MSDHPIQDAIDAIPKNELSVSAGASQQDGKQASVTFEREKGHVAGGVTAGITDRQGWTVAGFFKWVWGK